MSPKETALCQKCTAVLEKVCNLRDSRDEFYAIPDLKYASCALCAFVRDIFIEEGISLEEEFAKHGKLPDPPRIELVAFANRGQHKSKAFGHLTPPFAPALTVRYKHKGDKFAGDVFDRDVRFYSDPGSPAATSTQFRSGPYLNNSGSPEALSLLKNLYSFCLDNHSECRKTYGGELIQGEAASALPTRVLDLNAGDDTISLVITDGLRGHFAALSYCWGPPEKLPPRTTTQTIASHAAGMRESQLPRTYRDAIRIARHVGLRYLWIDSLCIVQDDAADWAREAARMAAVYQTAQLVIAAADSPDPTAGIFRSLSGGSALSATLPYFDAPGRAAGTVRAEPRPRARDADPERSVLGTRAWCAQESTLARRIAYFTRASLVWGCREPGSAGEGGLAHDGSTFGGVMWQRRLWSSVARDYSRRRLTYARDKLVALAGVASELGRAPPARGAYLFGLWESTLAGNLAWSRGQMEWLERPAELGDIPSWSWASTMGAVDIFEGGSSTTDAKLEPCVSIAVRDAGRKLEIDARLVPSLIIALSEDELDALDMPKTVRQIRFCDGSDPCGVAIMDQDDSGLRDEVVYCVPLVWEHPDRTLGFETDGRHICVILRPASPGLPDHFLRLGQVIVEQSGEVKRCIEKAPIRRVFLV